MHMHAHAHAHACMHMHGPLLSPMPGSILGEQLEPELAKINYAGLYKCKTREFMGQYGKMDGCAMFYRRDKFSILPGGAHDVEFNSIARMHAAPRRSNTRPAAT